MIGGFPGQRAIIPKRGASADEVLLVVLGIRDEDDMVCRIGTGWRK